MKKNDENQANTLIKVDDKTYVLTQKEKKSDKPKNGKKKVKKTTSKSQDDSEENEPPILRLERYLKKYYDFRNNDVLLQPAFKSKESNEFTPITDNELADIRVNLAKKGFKSYKQHLNDLIYSKALSPNHNPFISYFNSLPKWDETQTDHIGNLCKYIQVKDQDWFNIMLKKHLVRAVACVLRKIPFNKHCFVFQGPQNDGKTSLIRSLIPPPLKKYYKENPPLDHKDGLIAFARNFIINFDELDKLDKTEANRVKTMFSQDKIDVRLSHDRFDSNLVRYASCFGTINDAEFLNDVTGNVRWLAFEVEKILWDGENGYVNNIDINDVWSQALYLVNSGFNYNLTNQEIEIVNIRNKKYMKKTIEMELINKYIIPCHKSDEDAVFVQPNEIQQVLLKAVNNTLRINPTNIGKALTFLGFKRDKSRRADKYDSFYGYYVKSENIAIHQFLQNIAI